MPRRRTCRRICLTEAAHVSQTASAASFIATQEPYSLLERGIEGALLPTIERLHMSLIPYFPLASGMLTGKYRRGSSRLRARDWPPGRI